MRGWGWGGEIVEKVKKLVEVCVGEGLGWGVSGV